MTQTIHILTLILESVLFDHDSLTMLNTFRKVAFVLEPCTIWVLALYLSPTMKLTFDKLTLFIRTVLEGGFALAIKLSVNKFSFLNLTWWQDLFAFVVGRLFVGIHIWCQNDALYHLALNLSQIFLFNLCD